VGEVLNIADFFLADRVREGRGNRVALRLRGGELTYADVDALASRFGNALLHLDVRPEERVLVALPDGAEFVGALFGILKVGAVVVMVNPALPAEGLAAIVERSRARVAIVDPSLDIPVAHPLVASPGTRPDFPDRLDAVPTHRYDPAIWLFSGGTTGQPKIAVQTHASFANTTRLYALESMGRREDDDTLSVFRGIGNGTL
jgi:acyl-coenzyme A synthetase/AMP-(fatty) acid ligase